MPIIIVGNKCDLRPEQRQVTVEDAKKLAEETYFVKKSVEEAVEKAASKLDEEDEETPVSFAADPVEFIRSKVFKFLDLAKIDPVLAFKTHPETGVGLTLSVVTLFGMLGVLFGVVGAQQKPITKVCLCSRHPRILCSC